jgi:methylthioribose-1-phosphate isomerase
MEKKQIIETLRLADEQDALIIIDQTLLPDEIKYLTLTRLEEIREAICELRVRGAPAIGIAAGYGAYLAMKGSQAKDFSAFYAEFLKVKASLVSARPTAVNLSWALETMEASLKKQAGKGAADWKEALRLQADKIMEEDRRTNLAIGEYALSLLQPGFGILTHCNAGALATGHYGTATAAMYLGQERGYQFKIFADETRPLLQGARLTSFELAQAGIDVTLICDNMAASVMRKGWVQAVLVGCDRVAANGDTANKIGTYGLAILAQAHGIPLYVCAPTSTIDLDTSDGQKIQIEERDPQEIYVKWYEKPVAPRSGVSFFNPAFDVTDARYISGIVTEFGIASPPYTASLRVMMQKKKNLALED